MNNIEILKSLTQTTFDSVEGYRTAAEKTETSALRYAFERRLDSRRKTLEMLNEALANNGEERITSASMTGKAHQTFLSIAAALTDSDEAAIARVEEGEDYLAGQFKDALENDDLDAPMKSFLTQASRDVMAGERFSDMLENQYA